MSLYNEPKITVDVRCSGYGTSEDISVVLTREDLEYLAMDKAKEDTAHVRFEVIGNISFEF